MRGNLRDVGVRAGGEIKERDIRESEKEMIF